MRERSRDAIAHMPAESPGRWWSAESRERSRDLSASGIVSREVSRDNTRESTRENTREVSREAISREASPKLP